MLTVVLFFMTLPAITEAVIIAWGAKIGNINQKIKFLITKNALDVN